MADFSFSDIGDIFSKTWDTFSGAIQTVWHGVEDVFGGSPSSGSDGTSTSGGTPGSVNPGSSDMGAGGGIITSALAGDNNSNSLTSSFLPSNGSLDTIGGSGAPNMNANGFGANSNTPNPISNFNPNTGQGGDNLGSIGQFMQKNGAAVLLLGGMKLIGDSATLNQQKKLAETAQQQKQQEINLAAQQQHFTQQNSYVPSINVQPTTPGTSPFLPPGAVYNPPKVNTGIVGSGMNT